MCGICGMVGTPDKALIQRMCNVMYHRGPDDEGFYYDNNVALGVRRLSIIDIEGGHQPIYNEDKSLWLVFNGEIYNYKELRDDLIKKGHDFYTASDTEVIIHLYEEYNEDCVNFLRGMFSFAIWDTRNEKLFIARDGLGIKPLYYTSIGNRFLFASEIKAILEDRTFSRRINFQALDYYLQFLYIPAPLSIFEGINKLLPGHFMVVKNDSVKVKRYWDLKVSFENKDSTFAKPVEYYTEQIYEMMKESVKMRLVSDRPLGVFLSGGTDSSTIVGLMSKLTNAPIKTFSIGFSKEFESYNELKFSRIVADYFGTEHKELIVKSDILELLPKIIWHLDEPFADSSAILTYLISKESKKYVTVALTGIGGDEVFSGYPRYIGARLSQIYQKMPYLFKKGLKDITSFIPETTSSRNIGGWINRFFRTGLLSDIDRYINWCSYFTKEMKDRLYTTMVRDSFKDLDSSLLFKNWYRKAGADDYLDKIFYIDVNTYLADDLLFMADRMSLANSLEIRVPFCDHKLVELSAGIPYELKIKGLKLKSLLRKSMKDLLPPVIINRKKQGFMVPLGDWLRGDLKKYTMEILSEDSIKKRGYFNSIYIQNILKEHFENKKVYTHQVWALLVFELWCQAYIDS